MKKILLALILLVAAAAGGSYFMWDSYVTSNKDKLDKALKEQLVQMPELNVTYDVETSGFPLAAKLTYSNIRSEFKDPETGMVFTAIMNTPVVASASLFSPNEVAITSDNALITVDFPENFMEELGEEPMPITFSMGWDSLVSKHKIDNMNSGETVIKNMNFKAGAEAMPMTATIAKVLSRRDITETNGLVSGKAYARMDDMEVRVAVISVPIALYEVDASFTNFPVAKELQNLSRKLQLKSGENVTEEEFNQLIAVAKDMVQKMVDNGSNLTLNKLRVESDALQFNLGGGVTVTPEALLDGGFDVKVSGIQKFIEMLPADHPSKQMAGMATMMGDGENLELSLAFKDGMVVFNGAPVLPIPPINTLLDNVTYPEGGTLGMREPNVNSPMDLPIPDMHDHAHEGMDDMPMEHLSIEINPMEGGATFEGMKMDEIISNVETVEEVEAAAQEAMDIMETTMEEAPQVEEVVTEVEVDLPPQSEADFEVTEQDLQKMLMEIDETLKETNLP
ncbi:MAG: DUF2125 domain-containing protein [Pseudomonadota bacterium]|nr:DUF2125 domain-containing protein [Pseudomonadota bacterium]